MWIWTIFTFSPTSFLFYSANRITLHLMVQCIYLLLLCPHFIHDLLAVKYKYSILSPFYHSHFNFPSSSLFTKMGCCAMISFTGTEAHFYSFSTKPSQTSDSVWARREWTWIREKVISPNSCITRCITRYGQFMGKWCTWAGLFYDKLIMSISKVLVVLVHPWNNKEKVKFIPIPTWVFKNVLEPNCTRFGDSFDFISRFFSQHFRSMSDLIIFLGPILEKVVFILVFC